MSEIDPRAYWLWLQHALGAGSSKQNRILASYPSLQFFYQEGKESWLLEGYFTPKELHALETWSVEQAQALLDYCEKLGQTVITPDDAEYPDLLREIPNPPCALFVKGKLPDFSHRLSISIVGTRKATATGRGAARSIAFELAKKGVIIVSGGALGIDTAAHQGALQAGGTTVCVLGCGIDAEYLMVNASMRDAIALHGALVSEYPPQTQPISSNFPIRNRIIAGLSVGTLVVEAAARSGSLITADFALDQGRDVFAVPADIFSPVSQGVNNLIKSGAKPVSCAEDILEEYSELFPEKIYLDGGKTNDMIKDNGMIPKKQENVNYLQEPADISDDAKTVFRFLEKQPVHIEVLQEKTKMNTSRILAAITELELSGAVKTYSGGRYSLP
jgi:DNA processing protein